MLHVMKYAIALYSMGVAWYLVMWRCVVLYNVVLCGAIM